jgi:hypothetical protein
MNWKGFGSCHDAVEIPSIFVEGQRKIEKIFGQDNR